MSCVMCVGNFNGRGMMGADEVDLAGIRVLRREAGRRPEAEPAGAGPAGPS